MEQKGERYLEEVQQSLIKYLEELPLNQTLQSYQQLFDRLSLHIGYLLRHNQERLMQALYRIDVPERKVKEAFKQQAIDDIASELAGLVLDRELQKAQTRARYRNH